MNQHDSTPVEHLNRLFKNFNFDRGVQKTSSDKELQFIPPWETKIGQLQQVVRTLHRNANSYLQNRGSVIVRCYPFKSDYYMNIVYELIRNSITAVSQFARTHFVGDILPILLQTCNGACTPIVLSPLPFGVPIYIPHEHLTDVVLLRVRFNSSEVALYFLQTFNRAVLGVFDQNVVRVPFVHSDLTHPERLLRNRLQQVCQQKNAGRFGSKPPMHGRNEQYSHTYYRNLCQSGERYFHNGIQLYKKRNNAIFSPQTNSNSLLPIRIERVERRNKEMNKRGEDCVDASSDKKQKSGGRPPLIRVSFRNKEAAQAFCQLFKECQKISEQEEYNADHANGSSTCSSYSDLSESEVFIGKVGQSIKSKNERKHSKPSLFSNAFAHRDLTPPELALGYSLRIFCREKNGSFYEQKDGTEGVTFGAGVGKQQKKHGHFYVRGGRIFERSTNISANQTKT